VAHLVAQELHGRGHAIGVMAPSPGPAVDQFQGLGAEFHPASVGSLRGAADVRRVASATIGYDVLYSHTSIPGQILGDIACQVTKRAHVVHQHTVPRVSPSPVVGVMHRALYRATVVRRLIIAVAPHVRSAVLRLGARPDLVEIVPNGVDADALEQIAVSAPRHVDPRVGMLARFDPQKGINVFLEAAAELRDSGAAFVLGASGRAYPEHERDVRAEAGGLDVEVVDPGDRGAPFLSRLDIVVVPSLRAEGLPLTLLEAMALGKAVVASDVQGIGSIAGLTDAVVLVPVGDVRATADAIRALIRDPSKRMRIGARAVSFVRRGYRADEAARYAADVVERSTS